LEYRLSQSGIVEWLPEVRLRKLLFLISLIAMAYIGEKVKQNGFVNIPSSYLKKTIGKRYYKRAVQILEMLGVIEINHRYAHAEDPKKSFSKSYRFTDEFCNCRFRSLRLHQPRATTRKRNLKDNSIIRSELDLFIHANILRLAVDEDGFQSYRNRTEMPIERLFKCERYIDKVKAGKVDLKRGRTVNRIYHVVATMPKELRRFLSLCDSDSSLIEADFKSTFPVLLLSLYPNPNCAEAERLKAILSEGIYALFAGNAIDVKRQFGRFAFGRYRRKNNFGENFSRALPELTCLIRNYPGSLNAALQNLEAEIFIDSVLRYCMELEIFAVPIHDGFLIKETSFETVKRLVEDECQRRFRFSGELRRKSPRA
jgi:hypothetical protein